MKEIQNIAFEISPLLTASGSFGDKSGVYRYTLGLISALSDHIKKTGKATKIFLFSFNNDLLKQPLNPELFSLIKNQNVFYLNKTLNYHSSNLEDNEIFDIPVVRFFSKIINRIFKIKLIYQAVVKLKKLNDYISFLNHTLIKNNVGTVIHSETGFYPLKKVKNIITIYDMTTFVIPEFHRMETIDLQTRKLKFARRYCQGIICISKATKNDLIKLFPQFKNKSILIGYPGLDDVFFQKNKGVDKTRIKLSCLIYNKKVLMKSKKYLLYYGTFEPRKNLNYVVKAFLDLKESGLISPDFKLLLIGGRGWGNTRNSIIEYLRENYLDADSLPIVIVNFISDKNLINIIKNSYALIYPSFYEGFGLPVLEGMHLKVPVITSKNSSLIEVGGNAVLYVDPRNFSDVKKKMASLINDPLLAGDLALQGLKQSRKFRWEKTSKNLCDFISHLNELPNYENKQ